jgi:hypothetical protein
MAALSRFFNAEMNAVRASSASPFVVHVELADFRKSGERGFEELLADSYDHARSLAGSWVNMHGAMSAAIRKVRTDGSIPKVLEYVNLGDEA